MEIASLTSKHQITIPAEVRRRLNLHKGDRLAFEPGPDGIFQVRKLTIKKSDGAAVPYLSGRQKPLTREQTRTALAKGATASYNKRQQ